MPTTPNQPPNPFHGIPRIVSPQGQRQPITGQSVEPLPLEPSVVPNPPIRPEGVPRHLPKMPAPAARAEQPWFLRDDAPFPGEPGDPALFEDQVLWGLGHFSEAEVREGYAPLNPAGFEKALSFFLAASNAYANALTPGPAAPQPVQRVGQPMTAVQAEARIDTGGAELAARRAAVEDQEAVAVQVQAQADEAGGKSGHRLTTNRRAEIVGLARAGSTPASIATTLGVPLALVARAIAEAPTEAKLEAKAKQIAGLTVAAIPPQPKPAPKPTPKPAAEPAGPAAEKAYQAVLTAPENSELAEPRPDSVKVEKAAQQAATKAVQDAADLLSDAEAADEYRRLTADLPDVFGAYRMLVKFEQFYQLFQPRSGPSVPLERGQMIDFLSDVEEDARRLRTVLERDEG